MIKSFVCWLMGHKRIIKDYTGHIYEMRGVRLPPFLDYIPACREEVVKAITAAVEEARAEEREFCAKIAENDASMHAKNAMWITDLLAKDIANASAAVARNIERQIRARGKGEK